MASIKMHVVLDLNSANYFVSLLDFLWLSHNILYKNDLIFFPFSSCNIFAMIQLFTRSKAANDLLLIGYAYHLYSVDIHPTKAPSVVGQRLGDYQLIFDFTSIVFAGFSLILIFQITYEGLRCFQKKNSIWKIKKGILGVTVSLPLSLNVLLKYMTLGAKAPSQTLRKFLIWMYIFLWSSPASVTSFW